MQLSPVMKTPLRALIVVALFAAIQLSCDSASSPSSGSTQNPATQPTSDAGAPPAGGEATPTWIHEEFTNDLATPESCDFPWRFSIFLDGSFQAGPCSPRDQVVKGALTADELSQLKALVQPVLDNISEPQQCEQTRTFGADTQDLRYLSGPTYRYYQTGTQLCTLGGKDNATALATYVSQIRFKYYPTRPPQ